MPASLRALSDYDVRTGLYRFARLRQGLHLADEPRASIAYGWGERPWIAERKHDRGGPVSKSALQDLGPLRETPGNEAAADPGVSRALPFSVKPVAIAVASAKQSEPACVADCGGEPAAGDEVHRSEQDRVLNSERLRQTIVNGHVIFGRRAREQVSPTIVYRATNITRLVK